MAARRKSAKPRKTSGTKKRGAAKRPSRPKAKRPAPRSAASDPLKAMAPNGKPVPNAFGLAHHHMDYTSHDVAGVKRFYTEVLGLTNTHEVPGFGYFTVFVTPRSSFGFMAPMPGMPPESWSPPGEPNLYFFVEDVDRAYRDLTARGVTFDMPPQDMPWGHRMAVLRDPEGRRVCLAKDLKR